jgi:hypothetical protein
MEPQTSEPETSSENNLPNLSKQKYASWKRPLLITGIAIASLYGSACAALWVGQTRLLFSPTREITTTPAKFNAKYEEVLIPVNNADGSTENIHGWWLLNPENQNLPMGDRKAILYLHGNAKNIGANAKHANRLKGLGFSVLLIDYRGFGKSEGGFPSEASVYTDAQTAWDYLIAEGFKPEQILVYGHSMGGAIAIDLATKRPVTKGMVLDATFTSVKEMASLEPKYRVFPIDMLIHQRFDSIKKVRSLKAPVLYIHGSADELIPAAMSQQLLEATPTRKAIVLIANAGHNNTASTNEPLYLGSIRSFFKL